jgi:hypothetical protein
LALEGVPVVPDADVDVFPVVETGSLHLPVVEREAERPDEVKGGTDRKAGAAGVAGVPMDFRVDEDDVNHVNSLRAC